MSGIQKIVTLLAAIFVAGFIFVWFGVFNIAANNPHWGITTQLLEVVRDRSITARAEKLSIPNLDDAERIKRGAANYAAMCAQCHLAPGMDTSELHEGLYPKPPVLYKDDDFIDAPNETFWVIKNGIKMTAMPAWENYNSDEQIWDMMATIKAMAKMSAEQYQTLVESGKHMHKDGGHGVKKSQAKGHHDDGSTH